MSSEKQKTYPFMNVNAFTTELFRGNPATVVFLEEFLPEETLGNIAKNFNQSVTAFVVKSTDGEADYDICWYTQIGCAMALCGHGTLAATKAIYVTGRVKGEIDEIGYRIPNGAIIKVRKEGERLEIKFPRAKVVALSGEDHERIAGIVAKAMGRERVEAKYVGSGVAPFDKWLMVELDEKEDLRGSKMDGRVFVSGQ
jgi:PhzF family phenazine biosynthesis protein